VGSVSDTGAARGPSPLPSSPSPSPAGVQGVAVSGHSPPSRTVCGGGLASPHELLVALRTAPSDAVASNRAENDGSASPVAGHAESRRASPAVARGSSLRCRACVHATSPLRRSSPLARSCLPRTLPPREVSPHAPPSRPLRVYDAPSRPPQVGLDGGGMLGNPDPVGPLKRGCTDFRRCAPVRRPTPAAAVPRRRGPARRCSSQRRAPRLVLLPSDPSQGASSPFAPHTFRFPAGVSPRVVAAAASGRARPSPGFLTPSTALVCGLHHLAGGPGLEVGRVSLAPRPFDRRSLGGQGRVGELLPATAHTPRRNPGARVHTHDPREGCAAVPRHRGPCLLAVSPAGVSPRWPDLEALLCAPSGASVQPLPVVRRHAVLPWASVPSEAPAASRFRLRRARRRAAGFWDPAARHRAASVREERSSDHRWSGGPPWGF
jgi:hypothetical protein